MSNPQTPSPVVRRLDRAFEGAAWLILGLTPVLINVYNVDAYRTVQATFASILIAVALCFWAVARCLGRSWAEVGKVPMLYPIAFLGLWTLLTVPRSPAPPLGLASWWNLVAYLGFWIALSDVTAREPKLRWRLMVPILFGFVANSVIGLMQYQHVDFMALSRGLPQAPWILNYFAGLDAPARLGSAAGMLGNQNVLGGYLVAAIPLLFLAGSALLAKRERVVLAVALVASGLVGSASLVATQTRGAWVGLAIGLCWAAVAVLAHYGSAIRRLSAKTWIAVALGLAVALGGLAAGGKTIGLDRAIAKLQTAGTDNTSQQRINAWHVARTMADERPVVGHGLGTYKILYFKYLVKTFNGQPIPSSMHHRYVQAHNDFIQMAGETGYLGLILGLVVLFGFAGGGTWWMIRHPAIALSERMLVLGGITGAIAMAGSGIFGFPFHIASSSALAVGVAGLAGGVWTRQRREGAASSQAPAAYSPAQLAVYTYALPIAIAFVTFAVCWSVWNPYQADKFTKQGQELYKAGRVPEAQAVLDQAIRLDPERGDARLLMGLIYAVYGRFDQSEKELLAAQRSYDDVTLHYYLGRVYESVNRLDAARTEYQNALHYFPAGLDITKAVSERLAVLDQATKGTPVPAGAKK
ncbi:MAG TPA: O-antigen ligase family protein [Pantanalinema sp.]